MTGDPLIFVIAGEPSGDLLGGRLMAALMEETGGRLHFAGIGGESMSKQGLRSLFPMAELSLMGLAEVVPHIPRLLRRIRDTARAIGEARPAAVVTIDSPDFTRRVARRIVDRTIPRIHYVAPTVWAWRPWRARGFARDFDHLLALLPFEPTWFERAGLPCHFVGHPVVESGADKGDGAAFRARNGIAPDETVLCVLPGSRRSEVNCLSGDFGAALALLRQHHEFGIVVPTVEGVADLVKARCAEWPVPVKLVQGQTEKFDAMAASNLALAASGTVTLELALARVPHVMAYRVAPLTYFIVRRLLTNPDQYGNLVNIILDRQVIPEFVQENCRPEGLARELERLMGPDGAAQIAETRPALEQLGLGGMPAGRRAARAVLDVLGMLET